MPCGEDLVALCCRTRLGEPCLKTYPLECVDLLKRAKAAFQTGRTTKESFRLAQLEALVRMLGEQECDFVDALGRDLHKVWGKVTALCDEHAVIFPCCAHDKRF